MHGEPGCREGSHAEAVPRTGKHTVNDDDQSFALLVDERGTIRAASPGLLRFLNLQVDSLIGKSVHRVAALRALFPAATLSAIGQPVTARIPAPPADPTQGRGSRPLPLLSVGSDPKRYLLRASPGMHDIDALDESADRFFALVKNIPQGVFYKDTGSVYRACNPAYAEDLGTTPRAIVGKTEYDFHPHPLANRFVEQDKRIIASGATECTEAVHFEQGEERLVYKVKTPVRDATDRVIGVLGILWDITDRKRTESHLRRIVELQTNALDIFAHSIRDPLTVIRGYTTMLQRSAGGRFTEEQDVMLRSIADSAQELVDVTETFLDVDRIEQAAWSLRTTRVALDAVIYRAVDRFSDAALRKGLAITVQAESGVHVSGDEELLMEALSNLLSNAIRYSDQGTITASLRQTLDEALVSVVDEGRGIPENDLPYIFRRFYRIAHPSTGTSKGLGLGLPLAKSIIESHSGYIDVSSTPDRGSTFTIHLPLHAL